jgi:hypothetical protein
MPELRFDTVQLVHDISVVYNPSQGQNIITVLDNNPNAARLKYGLKGIRGWCNAMMDEIRVYSSIQSLPQIPLPDFNDEDSESERLTKAQSFEWNTARFELAIFKKAANSNQWAEFGVAALKNAGGFRYRIHRILDLATDNIGVRVGEFGQIGVQVRAVGFDLPKAADRISITGHWVQEFVFVQEVTPLVINQASPAATPTPTATPTPVTPPNLLLSLASGTNADATLDTPITLTVSNLPIGTVITGTWLRNGVATSFTESIVVSTSANTFSSAKFTQPGNYSLQITYQGTNYTSNTIPVILSPSVKFVLAAGVTLVEPDRNTIIGIRLKNFQPNTSVAATWVKEGVGILDSSLPIDGNGEYQADIGSSAQIFRDPPFGIGNYRLRVIVGGVQYLSNEITISIPAQIVATLPSGVTTASTASATAITITGRYFARSGSIPISYSWLRADNTVVFTSSGNNTINVVNNTFTLNLTAAQLQNATTGNYKLRLYLDHTGTTPYFSNEISVTVNNPSTVTISPTSANVFGGTTHTFTVTLAHFTNGTVLNTVWQREGVDLANTATTRTFNPASGTSLSYSVQSSTFYNGSLGNYRLKVTTPSGQILFSNNCLFTSSNDAGGLG